MFRGNLEPTKEELLDNIQALPKAAANVKSFFGMFDSGAQAYHSTFAVGKSKYTFVSVEDKSGKTTAGYVLFGKKGEENETGLLALADFVKSAEKKEFDLHGYENPERFLSNFFAAASVAERENITHEFKNDLAESLVNLVKPIHYFSGSKSEFAKVLADLKSTTHYASPKPLWQRILGLGENKDVAYAGQQAYSTLKLSYSMLHSESRNFEGDLYDYIEAELAAKNDEAHAEFIREQKDLAGTPLRTRIRQALPKVAGIAMMLGAVGVSAEMASAQGGRAQQLPDIGISDMHAYKGDEIVTQANATDNLKVCYSEIHSDPDRQTDGKAIILERTIKFGNTEIFRESKNVVGIGNGASNTCKPIPQDAILSASVYSIKTAISATTSDGEKLQESDEQNNINYITLRIIGDTQNSSPSSPALDVQKVKQYAPAIVHDSRPDTNAVPLYAPYNPHADDSSISNNHENFDAGKFPKENVVYVRVKETPNFDFYEYIYERAENPHWAGLAPEFFSHEHDTNYAIVKVDKRTGRPVAIAGAFHELGWVVKPVSDVSELKLYSEWGSHEFLTGPSPTANGRGLAITKENSRFTSLDDRIRSGDIDSAGHLVTNEPHKSIKGVKAPWLRAELSDPETFIFQKYSTAGWQQSAMWFELHSPADLEIVVDGKVTSKDKLEIPNSSYNSKTIGIMNIDSDAQPKIIVKGTGNGIIHLSGHNIDGETNAPNFSMEAPITNGQVYQVVPDWQAIAQNKANSVKISICNNGDGTFEKTIQQDSVITANELAGAQTNISKNNWLLPAAVVAGIAGVAGFLGFRRRPKKSESQNTGENEAIEKQAARGK